MPKSFIKYVNYSQTYTFFLYYDETPLIRPTYVKPYPSHLIINGDYSCFPNHFTDIIYNFPFATQLTIKNFIFWVWPINAIRTNKYSTIEIINSTTAYKMEETLAKSIIHSKDFLTKLKIEVDKEGEDINQMIVTSEYLISKIHLLKKLEHLTLPLKLTDKIIMKLKILIISKTVKTVNIINLNSLLPDEVENNIKKFFKDNSKIKFSII